MESQCKRAKYLWRSLCKAVPKVRNQGGGSKTDHIQTTFFPIKTLQQDTEYILQTISLRAEEQKFPRSTMQTIL